MLNSGDRILGLVGQSMGGLKLPNKRVIPYSPAINTSGALPTFPFACLVEAFAIGGGGGGGASSTWGGGGGGAAWVRFPYGPGVTATYVLPNALTAAAQDGGIVTLSLNGALILQADGGKQGGASQGLGGRNNIGMLTRRGGDGGQGSGVAGTAGEYGAAAGLAGGFGYGGGSAGFSDFGLILGSKGADNNTDAVVSPGGGMAAARTVQTGQSAPALYLVFREL